MKLVILIVVAIVLILLCSNKDEFLSLAGSPNSQNKVEVEPNELDNIIKTTDTVLCMFYAPWCPHCRNMYEALDKTSKSFSKNKNVRVVKINADKHKKLPYSVGGFPTIKLFKNGKEKEKYSGSRTSSALIKYIKSHI